MTAIVRSAARLSVSGASLALAVLTLWIPVAPGLCRAWCSEPVEALPPCHAQHTETALPDSQEPADCCDELESERLNGVGGPVSDVLQITAVPLSDASSHPVGSKSISARARPPDWLGSPYPRQNAPLLS